MNKIKTFILGSAAAVVAATGAQAADPIFDMKAPREPVYRCDATGFIELPGTDVCLKVGGFARARVDFTSKHVPVNNPYVGNVTPKYINVGTATSPLESWGLTSDGFRFTGTGRINFDARTQTEYGTVRAFVEWEATRGSGGDGGGVQQRHAFVQFGNWTMGHTWSTFDVAGPSYIGYLTIGDNTWRTPQIRYTQPFGNGFSFSVAVEDAGRSEHPVLAAGEYTPVGDPTVQHDRRELPAFVAALEAGGDWGSAKLAGVVLQNRARQWIGGEAFGTDSDIGWGVAFGAVFNTPTSEGSNLQFNATYTDGACQYQGSVSLGETCDNMVWGNAGDDPANNSIVDSVKRWNVAAGYQHFWTPAVSTTIGGGYGHIDYGRVGTDLDPDEKGKVKMWDVYANVLWTPVSRTTFGLEVRYMDLTVKNVDLDTFNPDVISDSNDAWSVRAQVVRSF